ncbi:MAG: biotin synthase BioB [Silvanigrellaceae bacterium]|nr:biotin synthase BioB [Silvanigrellaceae bacterium]
MENRQGKFLNKESMGHHQEYSISEDYDEEIYCKAVQLYELPLLQLVQKAAACHVEHWPQADIQRSTLLSIKTGNCPEDCSYCPQSARYSTGIEKHDLLPLPEIICKAKEAKASGATRFCLGAAWRKPPRGEQFERVLNAIKEVKSLGMEACVTLGLLNEDQAQQLKEAGLDYYNHNVDNSKEFYAKIITTREFKDRVNTLRAVRSSGIQVCCGGILGMGETLDDRIKFLAFLASQQPHPESVPLNLLVKVPGTPLAREDVLDASIDAFELVRAIAVARLLMPKSRIRLSAGRMDLNREAQAMCFIAGANSLFSGEKLLTTPLPGVSFDDQLVADLTMPISKDAQFSHVTQ